MKALDRYLQNVRVARVRRWIEPGSTVLDVGCANGALFRNLHDLVPAGVGVDLRPPAEWVGEPYELRVGPFPDVVKDGETFDAVVMLAVVEHVPDDDLPAWAGAVPGLLRPGGRLLISVPSPLVDHILEVLMRLRLIAGLAAHEHHGFEPDDVPGAFSSPHLVLRRWERFQLGLNNLFVFERR